MKLKTVEINGKQYAEIDTAGLPVYVHDDGKEIGFDAPLATKKITELNGEAKNHRLAKEAAEEKLAKFAAIEDPKKAIEALEMLSKIDQKKLIDAGQVDRKGRYYEKLSAAIRRRKATLSDAGEAALRFHDWR